MLRVQRNQLGSSSLPPAHADGAEQRTPPVRFATRYRLIGPAELAACVRVTEIANDGSRDINPVGELMFRSLTFFVWSEPVRAADSTAEHRFLPTSGILRKKRWHFRPHDTAEAVR
jgi:hypothetical protein